MKRTWVGRGWCIPAVLLLGCGASDMSFGTVGGAPKDGTLGGGPTDPAPTGQRWEPVEDDKGCGRSRLTYVLVDEICGAAGDGYEAPRLQAPMFRDGALFGTSLLAVDGTHLCSLDVSDPANIRRSALLSGMGQPIAVHAYGNELLVAAGADGLVRVDAANPLVPVRLGSVALPGFALDVHVDGALAYVAMGKAGLGVVDLATRTLIKTIVVPGYATGVTTKGHTAYVASCTTLAVVDLDAAAVVGQAWTPLAMTGKVLTGPAKDVEVVGDVAFVAAGRHGAVAIDVTNSAAPSVIGNCARPEPAFYASGVRASGNALYVAGGEYGILPLSVASPAETCKTLSAPPVVKDEPKPSGAGVCTAASPWEVVPWEQIWAPPARGKDPIQTLPIGDRVYAFGDARRIGTRAVDVRDTKSTELAIVGRYDEPRRAIGIAASGSRVLIVGSRGGMLNEGIDGVLRRVPSDDDALFQSSTTAVFTATGRWVTVSPTGVHAEGRAKALTSESQSPHAIVAFGRDGVALASSAGVEVLDSVTDAHRFLGAPPVSKLPLAIAADDAFVYVGAPEWTSSVKLTAASVKVTPISAHGVFDADDALDTNLWRVRVPRRYLASTAAGLVEVAGLGANVGLVLHAAAGNKTLALPPATYAASAADGDFVYLTSIDRSLYRSTLVTVSLAGGTPQLVSTEVFTGGAAGVAVAPGRVYVANADGDVRVYRTADGARPTLSSVVSLEQP